MKTIKNFKEDLQFKNVTQLQKAITEESKRLRRKLSAEFKHNIALFSAPPVMGQLLVCSPDGGRLEENGWDDTIFYHGKYPTIEELEDLYNRVIESGSLDFNIIYDCMVRSWDTFEDKFSGIDHLLRPSDSNFINVTLVSCKSGEDIHTEGKWKAISQPDTDGLESNYWSVTNGDIVIHVSGEDIPENEVNAKLIAAAPDLLEALIYADVSINNIASDKSKDEIFIMIRKAIKKATE